MPAERCRVGIIYSGVPQFYVRETEQKRGERWVAVPLFDPNVAQAAVFSEIAARDFVARLRSLGVNPWVEDCKDGRRIELTQESQQAQQFGDSRTPVRATLDDEYSPEARWYKLIPVNRPDGGAMWLLKCLVPGVPDIQLIYEKEPLSCLQRAMDLNFLQYGERAPAPEPQPVAQIRTAPTARRRIGDLR